MRKQVAGAGFGGPLLYCSRSKLENFRRTENREQRTDRQIDREFNYRGHSYPLWIVGVNGPILGEQRTKNREQFITRGVY